MTDQPSHVPTTDAAQPGATWTISSPVLTVEIGWSVTTGPHLVTLSGADGSRWAGDRSSAIVAVAWADGGDDRTARALLGASTARDEAGETLTVQYREGGHTVACSLRVHPTLPVAETWVEITAGRTARLTEVTPLRLAVLVAEPPTLSVIEGIQGQGGGHPTDGTYQTFKLASSPLTGTECGESGRRSTWSGTPWFALSTGKLQGILGGLVYSGSWERTARYDAPTGTATVEIAPTHRTPTLTAGQSWRSPTAFFGLYRGDLDDAAAVQHAWHRKVLSPSLPSDFPWVQYNTWYSYVCDLKQDTLLAEAGIAASLGAEVFYLDAGWWVTSPSVTQDRFTTGLGIWRESRAKFPDGLVSFSDRIRDLGMRFGIWVEPERVDLRRQDIATWQTDWLVRHDGRYVRADWPADTDSAWLCFGDQRAQEWAVDWISELIESTDTRWLKWDSNYWGICTHDGHGHDPGDGEAAQVAGVHAVMDRLIARFPDLVIENCAGGGTRMDFGMAAHSHAVWVNDATGPSHRVRFQNAGAAYLYPPATLNSWLIDSVFEHTGHYDQSPDVLRAMLRSRMLGAFGLSVRLVDWTEETSRIAAEEIAAFKGYRRHLWDGRFAHLTPQPEIEARTMATPSDWDAYQTLSADGNEGIILAFRNASADDQLTVFPKWLDPDATYRLTPERGQPTDRTGTDLARDGITIAIRPLVSERMTYTRVR